MFRRKRHKRVRRQVKTRAFSRRLRIEPLEARRLLAVVTVTTLNDTVDFNDGVTSLREAIFATHLVGGADTIEFAESLTSGGPATILLTQGELAITDALTINGPGAELLTIDASGNDPTPDENNGDGSRVFKVDDNDASTKIEVVLGGLTITGGDVIDSGGGIWSREDFTIIDCVLYENSAYARSGAEGGGAVFQWSGSLSIVGSTIAWNWAVGPIQSISPTGSGGGILSRGATVSLSDSLIDHNSVRASGGGLHLVDSKTTLTHTSISDNKSDGGFGGGISSSRGTLVIEESSVLGNTSSAGGGGIVTGSTRVTIVDSDIVANATTTGTGGGIYSSGGTLIVDGCIILGNTAASGGGIAANFAGLTVFVSTIAENVATTGAGGGILFHSTGGRRGPVAGEDEGAAASVPTPAANTLTIERSTIRDNMTEDNGGGVSISSTLSTPRTARIIDSTVSENTAGGSGGGIASGGVGAISLELVNSTVSSNSADNHGGGVFLQSSGSPNRLRHTTITLNQSDFDRSGSGSGGGLFVHSGTVDVDHTIIAANTDRTNVGHDVTGFLSANVDFRYSLIGNNSGSGLAPAPIGAPDINGNLIGGPTDLTRINARLGSLADHGGDTLTHSLIPGSPAIDAGDSAAIAGVDGVPTNDQRGAPSTRVYGGRIDIGAFEAQPTLSAAVGDYNQNGEVDAADFTVWRDSLVRSGITPYTVGDGNGDGVVDDDDRGVWAAHFGQTLTPLGAGSGQGTISASTDFDTFELPSRIASSRPAARATNGAATVLADNHREHALLAWLASQPETKPEWEASLAIGGVQAEKASNADDAATSTVDQAFAQLVGG